MRRWPFPAEVPKSEPIALEGRFLEAPPLPDDDNDTAVLAFFPAPAFGLLDGFFRLFVVAVGGGGAGMSAASLPTVFSSAAP